MFKFVFLIPILFASAQSVNSEEEVTSAASFENDAECGRTFGAEITSWHVALVTKYGEVKSGSLINSQWILTSGYLAE